MRSWVESRGRGEFRRISLALGMHTTLVSQVFRGRKSLTEEQAGGLARYMGLGTLETDFLLKLVQRERSGSEELRKIFDRQGLWPSVVSSIRQEKTMAWLVASSTVGGGSAGSMAPATPERQAR